MKVQLLGWKCIGLRCADMEIKLDLGGAVRRVSLVQMPNGTGKTTTLTCLRAALTGEAESWSPEEVGRFAPRGDRTGRGRFEVRLLFNDRPLTFSLLFDFSSSQIRYATTFDHGLNDKYDPPPELLRFLTPHFASLLIFDGELPQQLLASDTTSAEQALDAFFQTYLLDELHTAIEQIWGRETETKTAVQKKGLTQRRNRVDAANRKVADLERARAKAERECDTLTQSVDRLRAEEKTYVQQIDDLRERREELEQEEREASGQLQTELRSLMALLRLPHRALPEFGTALVTLKERLDRLRLPESTSSQFFEELVQEDVCVCGRPLDEETRSIIQERSGRYMGADTYGVINSLKTDILRFEEGGSSRSTGELCESVTAFRAKKYNAQSQISALSQLLVDEGDEELGLLRERLRRDEGDLENFERLLEELTRDRRPTDDGTENCIDWWKHELEEAKTKLAEVTETLALRRHLNILQQILTNARNDARARIAASVVSEMNQRLDTLLPGHGIRVAKIESSLLLDRQSGASQGQTLAVGYAFLTTLFSRGQHEFPFLVDAPVAPLDSMVRREVGRVLPRLCPQFVALVLDTERKGFVEELTAAADNDVLFLTAFEDSPRNSPLASSLPKEGVTRAEGSVVVVGRSYFESAAFPDEPTDTIEDSVDG